MKQLLALCALVLLAACGSPLVGGECKGGYTACDGRCVKLDADPHACGSCGHDCGGFTCRAGKCTTKPLPMDAGMDAGPGRDAGDGGKPRDTGTAGDGSTMRPDAGKNRTPIGGPILPDGAIVFPDATVPDLEDGGPDAIVMEGCPIGQTRCDGTCVDTRYDGAHCGDCATACDSGQYCKLGTCTNFCDPPLTPCGNSCVDEANDEEHCGGCDIRCVSGICDAGNCADVIPGNLVVIGHDYFNGASQSQARIVANAVFIAPGTPLRVLQYKGTAAQLSVDNTLTAINHESNGRQIQPTDADASRVSEQLRDADVFMIYAQSGASDAELTQLGVSWRMAVMQFLLRGGVVVLFDTVSSKNTGTYHLLEPADLFHADSRVALATGMATTNVYVPLGSGTDSVAKLVPSPYRATANSVRFVNVVAPGTAVTVVEARMTSTGPSIGTVVFHSIVMPPP